MLEETITLEEALSLETQGKIIIYNPETVKSPISDMFENCGWYFNWIELRKQFRKVSVQKLPQFVDFEYRIEHRYFGDWEDDAIYWVYMYAKGVASKARLDEVNSKGKYVYILTNVAYPGICKIGKAVTPSKRVKQINGAGTVSEWVLKYALPVTDDYKVESMVHKNLEHLRMDSYQGSKREFFLINFEQAINEIESVAEYFYVNKPTYY
jgi:hypothetical protein